jgi:nucleoside-diphosphate-sugar epimerase
MTILVTGADGFVGKALSERLHNLEIPICRAVRRIRSTLHTNTYVEIGDISAATDWTLALKDVTQVVHLAARVHVMNEVSSNALAEIRRINVDGTSNLARQAAMAGVRRFVFLSSIKVNGEKTLKHCPFTSNDVPAPEDAYSISKNEAEQALWRIAAETGMEIVVLRPPLIYGPGVKGNFLRLMQAIDKEHPLPFGAIQNKRSLVYLGNLIDAIGFCLNHPQAAGKTLMVSDGDDVSTPELVRLTAASLGRRPFLVPIFETWMRWAGALFGKTSAVDRLIGSLTVDIKPLQALGWKAPYTTQAGLAATAEWFRSAKEGV